MKKAILIILLTIVPCCIFAEENASALPLAFPDYGQAKISQYGDFPRGGAFALNFFLGFGIGSFVQGDKTGGIIGLVGDAIGVSLIYYGMLSAFANIFSMHSNDNRSSYSGFLFAGSFIYIGSRVFQLIRPWVYEYPENLAIEPSIDENGKLALTVAWRYQY